MADYTRFWAQFLKKAQEICPLYKNVGPTNKSYRESKKGNFHKFIVAVDNKNKRSWIEICFQEKSSEDSNNKFDYLYNKRQSIEKYFGETIDWESGNTREIKRSRIPTYQVPFDFDRESSWDTTINQLIDKLSRFIPAIDSAYPEDQAFETIINAGDGDTREQKILPEKSDSDDARDLLRASGKNCSVEAILEKIEDNFQKAGKRLKDNWRKITAMNIRTCWYK